MPGPWSLEEFAELTSASVEEIERFRGAGLLDPGGAGRFIVRDVLALVYARRFLDQGGDLATAIDVFRESDDPVARRLFQRSKYSLEEAAAKIGRTPEELQSLGTSFGFRGMVFDDDDVVALRMGDVLTRAGLPIEALFEGARVYGDGLQRLAAEGVQLAHRYLCEPLMRQGVSAIEIERRTEPSLEEFGGASVSFVQHLFVDYLTGALARHALSHLQRGDPAAAVGTETKTILFADLSLFSTLAELEGDEAAIALVDRTDHAIRALVIRHNGRLVKHMGDEFMLVFDQSIDAVRFAFDLQAHLTENERQAATRIGMHSGPVLYRLGDYYGGAVNVAARIVSIATANSILVTETIAKTAASDGFVADEIGVRTLRGMDEPLVLYRLTSETGG